MKDLRSVYVRYLPIVFLGAFLAVILNVFAQLHFNTGTTYGPHQPWSFTAFTEILKYGILWVAIGLGFRQIKAAACALAVVLLILAYKNHTFGGQHYITSPALSCLIDIFCNEIFTPGLVFLIVCFKKQALWYFGPLCLLAFGFGLLKAGSEYLGHTPYNAWFHTLGIDELLKVNRTEHSHIEIDLFYYIFYLIDPCVMFLLFGECYMAAATHKKLKEGLTADLTTRYTKSSTIVQFFALRSAINLLVVGVIFHPIIWMPKLGSRPGSSILTCNFILLIVCALALLAAITLYYRKFMVEYFISQNKKIAWLFWLVNIPVIGILVFPIVVLATGPVQPAASAINHDERDKVKPNMIVAAMLAVSLVFFFRIPDFDMPGEMEWLVWILFTIIQLVILLPVFHFKNGKIARQE